MKKIYVLSLMALIILTGCSSGEKKVLVNQASTEGIEEIYINFASTNVTFLPGETKELETYLTVYDNDTGVVIDKSNQQLTVNLDSNIARLFNLNNMPELEIRIPEQYKGSVSLDGSSGNVSGQELGKNNINVTSSSGDIDLQFIHLKSNVESSSSSGNASIAFHEQEPDLDLKISTNSGSQSVDLPLNVNDRTDKGLEGVSGNGSNKVNVDTTSGNITLTN